MKYKAIVHVTTQQNLHRFELDVKDTFKSYPDLEEIIGMRINDKNIIIGSFCKEKDEMNFSIYPMAAIDNLQVSFIKKEN